MNLWEPKLAILIGITLVLFTGVIAVGVWMYRFQYRTADARLEEWSRQFHFTVLDKQRANPLGTGPGVRSASNKQVMYRVLVVDEHGLHKRALVKIGSPMMGVLSSDLEVDWD